MTEEYCWAITHSGRGSHTATDQVPVWCVDFNWTLLYSVHVHVQLTVCVLISDFEKLDLALGPRTLLLRKSWGGGGGVPVL